MLKKLTNNKYLLSVPISCTRYRTFVCSLVTLSDVGYVKVVFSCGMIPTDSESLVNIWR